MLGADPAAKVYLAVGVTDMRKSIDGLAVLVADVLGADPLSRHFFAFCNRGPRQDQDPAVDRHRLLAALQAHRAGPLSLAGRRHRRALPGAHAPRAGVAARGLGRRTTRRASTSWV
ncbi:MAG: IS66 family insertion sequence element accessory protein TnpB [Halofilum sp. (in: g-proteobacteria)]|nr:IS66 family insertion sequence element accessory protein TnpB [Halofilum sp. (in: g-proteobacteria)]